MDSSAEDLPHADPPEVVTDLHACYFGAELGERTLVPSDAAMRGELRFDDWFKQARGRVGEMAHGRGEGGDALLFTRGPKSSLGVPLIRT